MGADETLTHDGGGTDYEDARAQFPLTHQLTAIADLEDEASLRPYRWHAHRPTPGQGIWYARTSIDGRWSTCTTCSWDPG